MIEGHTQLRACIELNKTKFTDKPISEKFTSLDEIKLWMTKHQLLRRNLTTVQKLQLEYNSKPIIEKQALENQRLTGKTKSALPSEKKIDTHKEIAKIAGVSRTIAVTIPLL